MTVTHYKPVKLTGVSPINDSLMKLRPEHGSYHHGGRSGRRSEVRKATELYDSMMDAYRQGKWNATIINAVHCAISSSDAYTVLQRGEVSASKNHRDSIRLLESINRDAKERAKHLAWLISMKSTAEYEARIFTQKEATEAVKHADRLYKWVKAELEL